MNLRMQLCEGVLYIQVEHPGVSVPVEGFSKQVEHVSFQWARFISGAISLIP